ncbi:MAG: hypothetical protein KDB22_28445 [Planctomycetales bacterium]|nr:hypothetical protein [Planctomycetales bacterium]
MKKLSLLLLLLTIWLHGGICSTQAALVFSSTLQADFEFEVVDGPLSAISGINAGDILPFRALGSLEFTLDDSVPGATSMAFTDVTGTLTGVSPGPFLPFEITPDVQFVGGSLDDIVRDGGGQIVSANVVGLQMLWEMTGNPAILGGADVLLYGTDPLEFNGAISAIPFAFGDVLFGPDDFEVFLDMGLGNPGLPGGDPLAVIGRNRFLTAVPEPSCLCLLAIACGTIAVGRRRATRTSRLTAAR